MMAAMSSEETVSPLLRAALMDRMEAWELIEFLNIPIETLIDTFEYEIVEATDELEELVGIGKIEDEE